MSAVAKQFKILRGVESDSRKSIALDTQPKLVASVIDEDRFTESGYKIEHHYSVFIHDVGHDWHWSNGQLRFFALQPGDTADILVVFETDDIDSDRQPNRFCMECGNPIEPSFEKTMCDVHTGGEA